MNMSIEEKDKYIADHLMKLSPETLRFMVADLHFEAEQLERQYSQRLGEMARLCDIVCSFVIDNPSKIHREGVMQAANEIMEYVEAVRPNSQQA